MFNERRAANKNEKVGHSALQFSSTAPQTSSNDRQRDTKLPCGQPPRYPQGHQPYRQQHTHHQQTSSHRGYGNQGHYNNYQQRRSRDNSGHYNDGPNPKRLHSDRGRQQQQHRFQQQRDIHVSPLASLKPEDTRWDIANPKLVGFSAKFAKTNGIFPSPSTNMIDSLTESNIAELYQKQKKLEEERLKSMGSQKLPNPATAKVSKTVIFKGFDFEKHSLQEMHKYLEHFLASTVIPNVSYDDIGILSVAEEDRVIVECANSIVATTLMSFNMKKIEKLGCVLIVKRPCEYIQLAKDLESDGIREVAKEGHVDENENEDEDEDESEGENEGEGENEVNKENQKDTINDTSVKDAKNFDMIEDFKEQTAKEAPDTVEDKPHAKEKESSKTFEQVEPIQDNEAIDSVASDNTKVPKKEDTFLTEEIKQKSNEPQAPVRILDEIVETASLVCVNNLDPELNNHEITEILSKYGTLSSLAVLIDKVSYDSNGVGFFRFKKLNDSTKKLKDVLGNIASAESWNCFLVCENSKNDYYQNVELTINNVKEYADLKSEDISKHNMSNTIQILNIIGLNELTDVVKLQQVETEFQREFMKLKGFQKMYFVKPSDGLKLQPDEFKPEYGRVYAKFTNFKNARACLNKICGKYFNGRLIIGGYLDEVDYRKHFI